MFNILVRIINIDEFNHMYIALHMQFIYPCDQCFDFGRLVFRGITFRSCDIAFLNAHAWLQWRVYQDAFLTAWTNKTCLKTVLDYNRSKSQLPYSYISSVYRRFNYCLFAISWSRMSKTLKHFLLSLPWEHGGVLNSLSFCFFPVSKVGLPVPTLRGSTPDLA